MHHLFSCVLWERSAFRRFNSCSQHNPSQLIQTSFLSKLPFFSGGRGWLGSLRWASTHPHSAYTCLKWITNRDLLHSTWNSAPCYVAGWIWRGVWGRMGTCICLAESLCCSLETITTLLLISYTPIQNKKVKSNFFLRCPSFECLVNF